MKNLKRILAATAVVGSAAVVSHAAPFLAVGDGAEVFFTGVAGVRYDSNIFLSASGEKSDTIFSLNPGLQYTFGKGSDTTGSLTAVEDFDIYSSHSNLNTQLFQGDFVTNYDNDKTKANLGAFYHQLNQNDVNVRGLARRDEGNATVGGEIALAEKESVGAAFTYDNVDFKAKGYSSSSSYTLPVTGYYALTPKLDLSGGYRYRHIDNDLGLNEDDNFVSVGARGDFTPKLTGSFDVGYENSSYKSKAAAGSSPSGDNLGFDANLSYAYTDKTTFILSGSNSSGTDSFGNREKTLALGLRGQTAIIDELTGFAAVNYQHDQYPGQRTDDFVDGSAGVSYTFSTHLTFTGGYDYRNNSSTLSSAKFTDNVLSVSASFRY